LILELQSEPGSWDRVTLIVVFPPEQGRDDVAIFANSGDSLALLTEAVSSGGEPIGLICSVLRPEGVIVRTRILPEHENDPSAQERLRQLAKEFEIEIAKTGIVNNLRRVGQA
jgi:hypothetical protein